MSSNWMPGARVITGRNAGPMLGGPKKVIWHTTENDPAHTTAANIAHYLAGTGNTVHLIWNPLTGETIQMIPANLGARGLENRTGGVQTNLGGTLVIQIEVVGRASQPFTDGPCVGLPAIQAWLASLGVPAVWSGTEDRSVTSWAKGGHFGHMDVPENSHTDPGRVNKARLAATSPSEPDMPLTPADLKAIVNAVLLAPVGRSGINVATALDRAAVNTAITQAQVEAALRTVLAEPRKP